MDEPVWYVRRDFVRFGIGHIHRLRHCAVGTGNPRDVRGFAATTADVVRHYQRQALCGKCLVRLRRLVT